MLDEYKDDVTDLLLTDSKLLLNNEEAYVARGDMEVPELQTYIDSDAQYLKNALRINELVRRFKNHDLETMKEKPYNNAVNGLSLSMY